MPLANKIVKNYEGNYIAGNELLTNIALNRMFMKLFDNDKNLISRVSLISNGTYRILPWVPGRVYNKNNLVWFVDCYLPPGKEEEYKTEYENIKSISPNGEISNGRLEELQSKYFTVTLYLLRSLKDGNKKMPVRTIIDMVPYFDASDWKNEYPIGSIYTDYFAEFTADNIMKQLNAAHQATIDHPFGELKEFSDIDNKVLLKDMSNISPDRSKMFFPNETINISETKSILGGACRKWDCGLLEYDLSFRLGNADYESNAYNADGTLNVYGEINSNNFNLAKSVYIENSSSDYDNRKYYLSDSDSDIFKIPDGITVSAGGGIQHNVDSRINAFYGKLDFQIPFMDTNYSIFPVNIPVVVDSTDQIVKNENTMVFVNKAKNSVIALFVIPNYNQGEYKILGSNSFRCRITGRWK